MQPAPSHLFDLADRVGAGSSPCSPIAAAARTGDRVDEYGGFSLLVNQCWWGHLAEKPSLLYVCGVDRRDVPRVVVDLTMPSHICGGTGRRADGGRSSTGWRPDLSRRLREATPPAFAAWLVELASRVRPSLLGLRDAPAQHGRIFTAGGGRPRIEHRAVEHGGAGRAARAAADTAAAGEQGRADPHGSTSSTA